MPALIAGTLFVLVTCSYGWGTLSASVPRWIVIYACASLVLVCWSWRGRWTPDTLDRVALSLFGYCVLSLSWSADWRQGAYSLVNMFSLLCVFLWVKNAPRDYVKWLPEAAGVALILALVMHDAFPWDLGGHGNRNFQTELMLSCLVLATCGVSRARAWLLWTAAPITLTYLVFWNSSKIEFWVAMCLVPCWLGLSFGSIRRGVGWTPRYSATA